MKQNIGGRVHAFFWGGLAAWLGLSAWQAGAAPRTLMPPWPEVHLAQWTFDEPLWAYSRAGASNQALVVENAIWMESWSGFALNRQGASVPPLNLPLVTPERWHLIPEEGAVRVFLSPAWASANTGLGRGPGHCARILELALGDGPNRLVFWSLYVSPDGTTLSLSTQADDGPVDCLKAPIQWQAGEWHMVAIVYGASSALAFPQPWLRRAAVDSAAGPQETHLYIDGQLAAVGAGLPLVPAMLAPHTILTVGSSADGNTPFGGQFEQLTTFDYLLAAWELGAYYESARQIAALGPVTPAEEAARRAAYLARKAAAESASLSLRNNGAEGGFVLESMQYTNGFWLLTPQITQGTNLALTLCGADTNKSYDIYYRPFLQSSNNAWSVIAARGLQGQTNFTAPLATEMGFYQAFEGDDWDWDKVPNYMDANPRATNVGALSITIESPLNGSVVQ